MEILFPLEQIKYIVEQIILNDRTINNLPQNIILVWCEQNLISLEQFVWSRTNLVNYGTNTTKKLDYCNQTYCKNP